MKNNYFYSVGMNMCYLKLLSVLLLFLMCSQLNSQILKQKSNNKNNSDYNLTKLVKEGSASDYVITSEHISSKSGIHHIYLRQAINGIEVIGTESSVHLNDKEESIVTHENFVSDIREKTQKFSSSISPKQAIISVSNKMEYGNPIGLKKSNSLDNRTVEKTEYQKRTVFYTNGGISVRNIPVKQVYYYTNNAGVILAWELSIVDRKSSDWYNFIVDASTGEIIHKDNFTVSCNIKGNHKKHNHKNDIANINDDCIEDNNEVANSAMVGGGSYKVFGMPIEDPYDSNYVRTIEVDPADANASPYGWHDTDGVAGAESFYTIGNNCDAYDDSTSTQTGTGSGTNAERAFGGTSLNFDFTFNQDVSQNGRSIDAAVTNVFYWTNIIHDVFYQYGFDEASGNFQENNYGNGGNGSDGVFSEAQDGSGTCNANFGTPADGQNPRMQMYTCSGTQDGDYDNVVIVHEYAHGISTRLTGGAGTSCLGGQEQMGEGWGDFFGLVLTMKAGDVGTEERAVGNYLFGNGPNGPGIRPQPYSTTNTQTYADLSGNIAVPHGVGSVWASILWKLNWALIDIEGWDPDIYYGTGGNNIALNLVTEALKLQPCSPTFVDGRDAILAADQAIYGGIYVDVIWAVFADAGIGLNANAGGTGLGDETTDTAVPPLSVPSVAYAVSAGTQLEGSNCDYIDVPVQINIGKGPSQNTIATFSVTGGNAVVGEDFDLLTTSITFDQGLTAPKDMMIRVYNDSFIEGDETIIVNFAVDANGGDATVGSSSYTLTINDDDVAVSEVKLIELLNSDFEGSDTTTWTPIDNDGDGNSWLDGISGVAFTGITGTFAVSESDGAALGTSSGNSNYKPDNFYHTANLITIPNETTNLNITYGIAGYQDNEPYEVYWTADVSSVNSITNGVQIDSGVSIADEGEVKSFDFTNMAGQQGYLAFRHVSTGNGPAGTSGILFIDNINITATVPTLVQTAVNSGLTYDRVNLIKEGTVYTTDSSGDVMLDIVNNNPDNYGCIDISVSREGNAAQTYNGSTPSAYVTDKTFTIIPTNSVGVGNVDITFYFSEAEVSGWEGTTGISRNNMYVHREGSNDIVALTNTSFANDVSFTGNFAGLAGTYYFGPESAFRVRLSPKVYLQGAALNPNTGEESLMRDDLRVAGYIDTTSPYDATTCNASVFNVTGTDAIVDWVLIELRDATTNTTVAASQSALLQRDGDVVGVDGTSSLLFNLSGRDAYVVIKHRNHLGVMTKALVSLTATTSVVDFTNGTTPITFGTDAQTDFGMQTGTLGMWAGDATGNGLLNYLGAQSDVPTIRSQVFNDPNNSVFGGPAVATYGSLGYNTTDINMDGLTFYAGASSDVLYIRNNIFNNPSNSVFGGPPVATYSFTQQLPEGTN